ncbi:NAD-dependent epimerase/dehydratase family protein [Candidatus Parcubacteria bacterium]|nr:MAG: NAD-dependent epimerase/dehydratase family protein [Candidatus Parcubacteria bacterium]
MKKLAALVTGASGFIGRVLCARLQREGLAVWALGRRKAQGPWDAFIEADVAESVPIEALQGADCVFHLAGKAHELLERRRDPGGYFRTNVEGTRRLLEESKAAGVRRFVFFSSVSAMGGITSASKPVDESAPCAPQTPYGESKLAAEQLVLEGEYVPEPVVLRLPMVYGPTQKGNLPRMIEAIARRRFPPLPEAHNKRSMVHVEDVVVAAMFAAEKEAAAGKVYIVTDGQAYSTREMYLWICEALGRRPPRVSVPLGLLWAMARAGDAMEALLRRRLPFDSDALEKLVGSAWYSSARIERELGFRPRRHLRENLPEIVRFLGYG